VWAAAELIAPGPAGSRAGARVFRFPFRRSAPPASGPTQDRLLKLITSLVSPEMDKRTADACASVLADLRRPETVNALRALVALPYERYRPRLIQALKALGETVEAPPPSGPVRFLLLDHGAPLTGMEVAVDLHYAGSDYSQLSTSRTPDSDGIVSLERDDFVDPQNPISVVAFRIPSKLPYGELDPEEPMIYIWQPPPHDLSALTEVDVDFAKLTVNFRFSNPADLEWSFLLDKSKAPKSLSIYTRVLRKHLPASGRIVFSKVARGSYKLEVKKKGSWKPVVSRTFEMTGRDQTIDLSEQ